MICENCMKFRFQCPYIKFYWKTTMLIHFYVVYGCFCITAAELNCDRDFMSCQAWNINFLVIYRKSLSISIQTNSNGTQFSVDQSVTKLQIIIVFEFILQGWVPGNSWSKERKIKIHLINSPAETSNSSSIFFPDPVAAFSQPLGCMNLHLGDQTTWINKENSWFLNYSLDKSRLCPGSIMCRIIGAQSDLPFSEMPL